MQVKFIKKNSFQLKLKVLKDCYRNRVQNLDYNTSKFKR
jgi:hypothetical protein